MRESEMGQFASFHPAWKSFAVYFLGVLIFALGPELNPDALVGPGLSRIIALGFLAFILYKRLGSLYKIDAARITALTSLPPAGEISLAIADIRRIDLRRGVTQRLLGVAHVHLYVEGQAEPAMKLFGVPNPQEFQRLLVSLGAGDARVTGAWRR